MRWLDRTALALAFLLAAGCIKATALPRPDGGYTLLTTVDDVDDAAMRFRRSAAQLCHGGPYTLAPMEPVDREWHANVLGAAG